MTFTYDANLKKDWGYVYDRVQLKTNDDKQPDKRVNIAANIVENFGELGENAKVAQIKFDKTSHNFGEIKQNTRNTAVFTITNTGEAELIIRKTKASCGCTITQPKKKNLAPGESTTMDVIFSSGTKSGKQKKYVTLICNDPKRAEHKIYIEANIKAEAKPNTPTPPNPPKRDN